MANNDFQSSASLEREVEAQRAQVESTIHEIKERLTPGQLVDEMLSYTKHGGAHFAANLGSTVTANPLPVALIGVGLAWLMSGQKPFMGAPVQNGYDHRPPTMQPSYGTIRGSGLRRMSHERDEFGDWYMSFADEAGTTYRARSDELGRRTGNFIDNAGKAFSGFVDETGRRVSEFRDEAGNLLENAAGWANHLWQDASTAMGQQAGAAMDQASHMMHQAQQTASDLQHNAARVSRDTMRMLEDQPLIMGALAFAAGAALGATLPRTRQEDELLGETADSLKREAGHVAADLYEQGKEKVAEVYEDVSAKAGEIYSDARERLAGTEPANGQSTHH